MAELQNVTKPEIDNDGDVENQLIQEYAAFVAVGGLLTEDDGTIKKMSLQQFADELGVARMTLYRWKKLEGFWDLVEQKRRQIFTQSRITAVWNGLFLRAAKGDAEQAKIILGQYANWQPPAQKQIIEAGESWAAFARQKVESIRKSKDPQSIVEGEVVDATSNTSAPIG